MFDIDRWSEIWITITRNKMRSILTAFGVFWGIFMLVVMLAAGNGLQNGMKSNVAGFATNTTFLWNNNTAEPYKGFKKGRYWTMKSKDVDILRRKIKDIKYISPIMQSWWSTSNNVVYKDKIGSYNINGHMPVYNQISPNKMLQGRFINDLDIKENRKVCVIGTRVADEMFQGENPLGKFLKVSGIYYQVVGIMKPITKVNIGGDPEKSIFLPFTTMRQAYNMGDDIYFMAVTAKDGIKISELEPEIFSTIKQLHTISPTDSKAISSFNLEQQFSMFNNLFLGVNFLIWIVGLGTLIAGVVGVSNIMLVTVRERTKEIGIRRALGARPKAIISQIILESVTLTSMAGILGICFGVGLMYFVDNLTSKMATSGMSEETFFLNPQISFWSAFVALIIIIISGIAAGIIPAFRAMKIKAIDALNEE